MSDGSPGEEELPSEFGEAQSRHFDVIEACCNTQEQVGDHRRDDLQADGIFVGAEEFSDVEMLLDPTEQEFDLPSRLIEAGDLDCRALEIVADEGDGFTGVWLESDAAQRDIELGIAFAGKLDLGIIDDAEALAGAFADISGFDGPEPGAGFWAGDEKSLAIMDICPPIEAAVGLVEDIGRTSLDQGFTADLDIIDGGLGDLDRVRDVGLGIVDDMHLHAANAAIPFGPAAELAEWDGTGVDQTDHLSPVTTGLSIGHTGQHGENASEDLRRPANIGIRQSRAGQRISTEMVMMIAVGIETQDQRPQATGMIELGIDESHQMIPAGEGFVVGVTLEALDDGGKLPAINGFKKAGENARSEAHARLSFCVLTTREYQENPDLAGMHPATDRLVPRTALR